MAKYLITGRCGFIGPQLSKMLIELDHEVIVIDDPSYGAHVVSEAKLIKKDMRQPK